MPLILTGAESALPDAQVRWICVGTVWERDAFWTAAMREPTESSPLFGFSSQALWSSMVFPDEAAMLEAFTIAYDELGIDEHGEVHPFFVEWVTRPPNQHDPEGAPRAHRRIVELAATWRTDHPCWVPGEMPRMCTQPRVDDWSAETVATILGVGR